jgi:multiple sugar transport system substrate-binding protein
VPSRRSAFAEFPEYAEVPYRIFRSQLETAARPRPRTAFYATLTRSFAGALRDISRGADVAARLKKAEDEVQRVIDRKTGEGRKAKGEVTGDGGAALAVGDAEGVR